MTFVEVARRLSFSGAARALGVPASTVTTRINALEGELGVRMLNRSTRKTALTPEGREFLAHCVRALEEIETGREKLAAVGETSGLVRISLPSAFPKAEFASLIAEFRALHPKISIETTFDDALADFIEDRMDLALRGRVPGADGLFARKLASTPVVFVSPSAGRSFSDLPILTPLGSGPPGRAQPPGAFTTSMEFALELVVAGQVCAYLPLAICNTALASGQIVTSTGPLGAQEPLDLFLIYHERRYQPRRVALFKDFLISRLSD